MGGLGGVKFGTWEKFVFRVVVGLVFALWWAVGVGVEAARLVFVICGFCFVFIGLF